MKTINLNKEEILPVLGVADCIVNDKSPVSTFKNVVFAKQGIMAVNNFCSLFHQFQENIDIEEGIGVSPRLFKVLKKMEEAEFVLQDNFLQVSSESTTAKMNYTEDIDSNNLPFLNDSLKEVEKEDIDNIFSKFEPLSPDFISALKMGKNYSNKADFATSPEEYSFCIHNSTLFCSNKKVLFGYKFEGQIEDMMIPVESLPALIALDPVEYFCDESFIYFKSDDMVGRTLLRIQRLIPTSVSGIMFGFFDKYDNIATDDLFHIQGDFKQNIDEVGLFIPKDGFVDSILFEPKDDHFLLSAKNAHGKIKKEIFAASGTLPEKMINSFMLSFKFLKPVSEYALSFYEDENCVVFFNDNTTVIIMKIIE